MKLLHSLIFTLLTLASTLAHAEISLKPGSYSGRTQAYRGVGTHRVHMVVREVEGDSLAVFAALIMPNKNVCLYKVTSSPDMPGSLYFVPWKVDPKTGKLGANTADPALQALVSKSNIGSGNDFELIPSGNGNSYCLQDTIDFSGGHSGIKWLEEPVSGKYKMGIYDSSAARVTLSESRPGDAAKAATLALTLRQTEPGNYLIKEQKIAGVYTSNKALPTGRGTFGDKNTRHIILFVKRGCKKQMYIVNPADHTDVLTLTHK